VLQKERLSCPMGGQTLEKLQKTGTDYVKKSHQRLNTYRATAPP